MGCDTGSQTCDIDAEQTPRRRSCQHGTGSSRRSHSHARTAVDTRSTMHTPTQRHSMRHRSAGMVLCLSLSLLLLLLSLLPCTALSNPEGVIRAEMDAFPRQDDIASFATTNDGTAATIVNAQAQINQHNAEVKATPQQPAAPVSAPASPKPVVPRSSYVPVSEHSLDDPLQHLFSFDASSVGDAPMIGSSDDEATPAFSLSAAFSRAYVNALAPLVVRVARRVVSVGQWSPPKHASSTAPATPPAAAPYVTTNTLNMAVRASYVRGEKTVQRSLQLSVLPGPSFTKGSMAAMSDAFGAEAIGFEADLFSMLDRRSIAADASAAPATPSTAEDEDASFVPDSSDPSAILAAQLGAARLPGWGPISALRTMSGQHNENWILYSSGVRVAAPDAPSGQKIKRNVALYSLLVHAYNDPTLAKAQMEAHAMLETEAALPGSPTPRPPPLSMNALGVRLRVQPDFAIRPFLRGRAAMGPSSYAPGQMPMYMSPYDVELLYDSGANNLKPAAAAAAAASDDDDQEDEDALLPRPVPVVPSTDFATIVDVVCYQQKRFLFVGVAYSDGFLRIFSRNGTLRNEINSRNDTILAITMSNWGSLSSGANGRGDASNVGLNGANNGNQMMLYSTPAGVGLVKMARIHQHIDQYCAFTSSMGVASGRDVSAIAFDAAAQSILYLANHVTRSLIVMSVRLGWDHAEPGRNFDEHGLRKECPPTGCECHALASSFIPLRILSATTGLSQGTARSGFNPLYSMLSMKGFLLLASADAVAVFNSSQVGQLTTTVRTAAGADEVESGLEFMFERSVGLAAAAKGLKAAPAAPKSSTPLHLSLLQADRIDLLLAGALTNCLYSPCASGPTGAPPLSVFAVFQSFLPKLDLSSAAYSWGLGNWLTGSRTPIFLFGLAIVFGWQWMQRRAQAKRDEQEAMEAAVGNTGFRRRNAGARGVARGGRGGRGGLGGIPEDYSDPDGESAEDDARFHGLDERALRELVAKQGGADPDTTRFMKDFLEWQQNSKRAGSSKGPATRSNARPAAANKAGQAQYMSELASERARFNDASTLRSRVPSSASAGSQRSAVSATELAATKRERDRIQMRRTLDAMSPREAAEGLGIGGFVPVDSTTTAASAAASSAETEDDGFRALQAVARAAHDADVDVTEDMPLEAQVAGVNYDSDDHPAQVDSDVEEELALQADEARAARAVARAAADDAASDDDDDDDDDGPPHDGPFTDYSYDHSEFAHPQPAAAASSRPQGGYSTRRGTRATDLIDAVNREEEEGEGYAVDSANAVPQLNTFPIDQPLEDEDPEDDDEAEDAAAIVSAAAAANYSARGFSYEQQLAQSQAEDDQYAEDDEYGEEDEAVDYDEEGYAVPRGAAAAADDLTDAEREAEWQRLAAQARSQHARGPAVPSNAPVRTVGGFGKSVDDVAHYTDAHDHHPADDDLDPEDDEREEWVDERQMDKLQAQMQRTKMHEPATQDHASEE